MNQWGCDMLRIAAFIVAIILAVFVVVIGMGWWCFYKWKFLTDDPEW